MIETFIEIELKEDGDFLKVKETLTRIGVADHKQKILKQSCHILHKRGKFYIVHFKELYDLDDKHRVDTGLPSNGIETTFSEEDLARRNTIARLLEDWGLVKIANPDVCKEPVGGCSIKILPFREKANWTLKPKYAIGKKKYVRNTD